MRGERRSGPPRRWLLSAMAAAGRVVFLCAVAAVSRAQGPAETKAATVRIEVLSLFRPKELVLGAAPGARLHVEADGQSFVLRDDTTARVSLASDGTQVLVAGRRISASSLSAVPEAPSMEAAQFWIEVPGKLRRRYAGSLAIAQRELHLQAVVTMPLEIAVASVVAAESPPGAGIEALKAQAVASRSFLLARQAGHVGFDFCDTTHCQFLRSPPAPGSRAAEAVRTTRGLILTWHDAASARDRPLAAMYARSCGGQTRSLRDAGIAGAGYPYFAVRCAYCTRHPEEWRRELPSGSVPRTEKDRLLFNRIHGWGAIPSLGESARGGGADAGSLGSVKSAGSVDSMAGRGVGHGIGLCQLGAADMARRGASFDRILTHYYPNTRLVTAPTP